MNLSLHITQFTTHTCTCTHNNIVLDHMQTLQLAFILDRFEK